MPPANVSGECLCQFIVRIQIESIFQFIEAAYACKYIFTTSFSDNDGDLDDNEDYYEEDDSPSDDED